jgi:hypothetical protein
VTVLVDTSALLAYYDRLERESLGVLVEIGGGAGLAQGGEDVGDLILLEVVG